MAQIYPFSSFPKSVLAGVYNGDVLTSLPFPVQMLKQVHGTEIVEVKSVGPEVEGDALFTRVPGVRLLIKSADCIPLVLADAEAGLVAGVHAGWRGLVAEIVPKTLERLAVEGAEMARLQIGIGPSLGVECARFTEPFKEIPEKYHWAIRDGQVDLWAILERQLRDFGVDRNQVEWMKECTACHSKWFSWRRNADVMRFGSFIELVV
ncbi:polyphenol oxidase family protein [Candidatus Peregrinibacteria bacterium]|nr:MAG: polyphenol oxidase family protein [Candidatus Peregrinibacteria bacterium]